MEKSREIIRQLKEEKRLLDEEMKTRIDVSVGKLEEEREGEIQELKRGKIEALRLMQVRGRRELSTLSKAYTEYSFFVTPPSQKSNFFCDPPSQK